MSKGRQISKKTPHKKRQPLLSRFTGFMSLLLFSFVFLPDLSWYLYCALLADLGILFKHGITEQLLSFHLDLVIVLYINIPFKIN